MTDGYIPISKRGSALGVEVWVPSAAVFRTDAPPLDEVAVREKLLPIGGRQDSRNLCQMFSEVCSVYPTIKGISV